MIHKRIIRPIAFVIAVCAAVLCCACSVEREGDDLSSSPSGTDYEQSISEEDGSSESSSSLSESSSSSDDSSSASGGSSSSDSSSSSSDSSSSGGSSEDASDSSSSVDSSSSSDPESSSSDISSSESGDASSSESSSSAEGSSEDGSSVPSERDDLFIKVSSSGRKVFWSASDEIISFAVYLDGEILTNNTMDKSITVNREPGVYLVEVFGFLKEETKPCRSASYEYVIKIAAPSLTVDETDGKTVLRWNECLGADGYKIYKNNELMCDTADLFVEAQGVGEYIATAYSSLYPQIASEKSSAVTIAEQVNKTVPVLTVEKDVISFTLVGAKRYIVCCVCNGEEKTLITSRGINKYSLKSQYQNFVKFGCGERAEIFVKAVFDDFETRSSSVFVNLSDLV